MQRRLFLASLAGVAFGKNWDKPEYPNWTREFVDEMLTDSPWARPLTAPFALPNVAPFAASFSQIGLPGGIGLPRIPGVGWPGGSGDRRFPVPGGGNGGGSRGDGRTGGGVKTEAYLTVRWSSALPVRQALALAERASEVAAPPREYLIHLAGIPTVVAGESTAPMEKLLLKTAALSVKGRRTVYASSADVPEHGTHLMAAVRFPRMEGLEASEGAVEFFAEAGPIKVLQRFPLKAMVYRGNLEL
ncbi:MAG: hypothetical protein JNK48_16145 [Bryobacterales bacterium]|nr:hypothetical protein [Bryobacterales bacterium]